ncbi:hypothetical protein [Microbacterium sp. EST19A]|uniref:hypothetical protein n=1 Tax=Microbacterium sp. EST19A TaxID=2862681 RepID=UPI001CBBD179|nr:hypothetical protein [Microbacterium sp. EST19A]
MDVFPPRRSATAAATLIAVLSLAACVAPPAPDAVPAPASDGHGLDAGTAAEVASPALALVIADAEGAVTLLDLESEERSEISAARPDIEKIDSDGRLVYIAHSAGGGTAVDVIDTARWTAPHGDHTHSFLGEPRMVGTLEGAGDATITAGAQRATVRFDDGDLVVLAHDDLAAGFDDAARTGIRATGSVVPFADHLLATADAGIAVTDTTGTPVSALTTPCTSPSDADITRVGAVFTCAEGAVLFTREVGGALAVETVAYPVGAPGATELSGRADRPDLAGVAGDRGAWLLDVRERQWTHLPSDVPLVRAVAIGDDDGRTVAIDAEGRVRVLSSDGTVLARTEPLLAASVADPALRDRVQLVVDARHAYVSDPAAGAVHEIDHADAVVTRTFTDLDPWLLRQVG